MKDIVDGGYVIIGSPDEVVEQIRHVAKSLNVGHLMLLLQYGNMSKDTTKYNTRLFAEKVMPKVKDLFGEWEDKWWPKPLAEGPTRRRSRLPSANRRRGVIPVSQPVTTTVEVNGFPCRVWTKGKGPKVGFLAGLGGLPRWLPFLDKLAETRTVIAPSLPGYPGATGHTELDSHLDWVLAVRQLIDKAGLAGADLVGASVGGAFAAEMAAIFPDAGRPAGADRALRPVRRPGAGSRPWAQRRDVLPGLMCADGDKWTALGRPRGG